MYRLYALWCLTPLSIFFSYIVWSVLMVEKTGGPGENRRHVASHIQTASHIAILLALIGMRTQGISGDKH